MRMTNAIDRHYIEDSIGYHFKNFNLLLQAFTRKSYTEETHDWPDNEVLEFYGDKALDFVVTKELREKFGFIDDEGFFHSGMSEGELTKLKEKLVCGKMLASRIRVFGFQYSLQMGRGDLEQKVWEKDSVQEDLFEAIVGAVAIDSNWNIDALSGVVGLMLDLDFQLKNRVVGDSDYVQLLQQWYQKKYRRLPVYMYRQACSDFDLLHEEYDGTNYQCDLAIAPLNYFRALGKSKTSARMAAAKKAYQYIEQNNLLISLVDEVGFPDPERAVNQLQELYQKGYIGEPQYRFVESHDKNGNPSWYGECSIPGLDLIYGDFNPSKKQCKKNAAYKMVEFLLHWENGDET